MQTVVIVIHLMLVSAMIGLVLLQRSEGGGLGMGSGGGGFMSSRGTANILTRATAILAALFFVTSLSLSIIASIGRKPASILGGPTAPASQPGAPSAPPLAPGGNLLDTLRGQGQQPAAPAAPAAPSGPQVPQSR